MARPEAGAVIAVEVFVEQDVILPLGIGLEFLRATVHRPPAGFIPKEDPLQTIGYFMGDLEEIHQFARAGGTLDFEVVTVIEIERSMARISTTFTGIHIGPRQLEFPPNMPVSDSAGRYFTRYSWHSTLTT